MGVTPKSMVAIQRVDHEGPQQSGPNAIDGQARALYQNQAEDGGGLRAQRQADADFVGALADVVGDHAIDADGGQQERDAARRSPAARC